MIDEIVDVRDGNGNLIYAVSHDKAEQIVQANLGEWAGGDGKRRHVRLIKGLMDGVGRGSISATTSDYLRIQKSSSGVAIQAGLANANTKPLDRGRR